MKGCIIAGVVLAAMLILIVGNAAYVHRVTDDLLSMLNELPAAPDPTATPAEVAAIREELDGHMNWLSLSVSYTVLDRAREALLSLETQAQTGDTRQYAASIAILRDLLEDFARLERVSWENILWLMPPTVT